jgi:hypothetical protein
MFACCGGLAEQLDPLAVERWNVVRFATGRQIPIDHNFLVHSFRAGIPKISVE